MILRNLLQICIICNLFKYLIDVGHSEEDPSEDDGVEDAHQGDEEDDPQGDEGDLPGPGDDAERASGVVFRSRQ